MCQWCTIHGTRDAKWYENFDNYILSKCFPTPEEQQRIKEEMKKTFAEAEWRYSDPEFVRNPEYLKRRGQKLVAQVITKEEMLRVLKLADEATKREDTIMAVGHCPCKMVYTGKRYYCCVGFGVPIAMAQEIGYGRLPKEGLTEFGGADWRELRKELTKGRRVPLKYEEGEELVDGLEEQGLIHLAVMRGRAPLIEAICNCDRRFCTYWRIREVYGEIEYFIKGHYFASLDPEKCNSCARCVERCHFGAIHYSKIEDTVYIEHTRCFGCGLCRTVCRRQAIAMLPRDNVPSLAGVW